MALSYAEKLRDPRWQKKRLEVLSRNDFVCENCWRSDKPLHVHHTYYTKGSEPWDYPAEDMQSLCEDCHKVAGDTRQDIIKQFLGASPDDLVVMRDALVELQTKLVESGWAGMGLSAVLRHVANNADAVIEAASKNLVLKALSQEKA